MKTQLPLTLQIRTPTGVVVDRPVFAIVAEDLDGWFGIRPGRADLIAVLPPGLMLFRDQDGENFVALSGGILDLHEGISRLMCGEAAVARRLEDVADIAEAHVRLRRDTTESRDEVMGALTREMQRRLAREAEP